MSFSMLQPTDDIDNNLSQSVLSKSKVEGEVGIPGPSKRSLILEQSSEDDSDFSCSEEENIVSVLNYFVTYN